jgi:glycosyltransferase involved in cell wall biosynthesis
MSENITKPKITALAITLNEEENVKCYVESLSFVDEIIFIDSFSTDRTVEIAREMGVIVIQNKFENFSSQRNFGISQAKNEWITFFDLDEIVTPELAKEILKVVVSDSPFIGYYVKRNFYFLGKLIRFGGWQKDKVIRIFNKKFCRYNGNLVHEVIITNGKVANLKNSVNHFSYKSFDNYNNKLNHYSKLQAESLYRKNKRPNAYHFFIRPLYRFFWQYFYRLGFIDGKTGFVLAYVHSFSVFKRYLQLWMRYRQID